MTENAIKHLEFIQSIITRMNTNSFQLKQWTITIVAALLAIFASTEEATFVLISLLPVIVFWLLDAFYLMQERKFRGLYDDVAGISEKPKAIKLFEMRPDLYVGGRYSYLAVMRSITIAGLYLPLLIILIGLYAFLKACWV